MLDPAGEALSKRPATRASQALRGPGSRLQINAEDWGRLRIWHGLRGIGRDDRSSSLSEARAAIQQCTQAGIKTIMITGCIIPRQWRVARELGGLGYWWVITGSGRKPSEPNFERAVENISVYARRLPPAHKLRVVTALQRKIMSWP